MNRTKFNFSFIKMKCNTPFDYNKHLIMKNYVGHALYYTTPHRNTIKAFNVGRCEKCLSICILEEWPETRFKKDYDLALCTLKNMGLKRVPYYEFYNLERLEEYEDEYICESCLEELEEI